MFKIFYVFETILAFLYNNKLNKKEKAVYYKKVQTKNLKNDCKEKDHFRTHDKDNFADNNFNNNNNWAMPIII